MDGWNTIVSFWEGPFSGAMLVLGRVSIYFTCSSSFSWLVYILDLSVSLLISYYTTLLSPAFLVDTAPHWCQILATWVVYVSIVPAERHLFQPRPRQSTSNNSDWCDSLPDSPLSEPGPWKKLQIPQKSNLWKSDHKFWYISTHTHKKPNVYHHGRAIIQTVQPFGSPSRRSRCVVKESNFKRRAPKRVFCVPKRSRGILFDDFDR